MDTSDELRGRTWVLVATTSGTELDQIVVTAEFDGGRLSGTSGCNRYTTAVTIDGSMLTIDGAIAGTRKLCDAASNAVEAMFLGALPRVRSFAVDGHRLVLQDHDGTAILTFEATDLETAIRGEWTVINYYRGDAVTTVVGAVTLTAEFDEDALNGSTGVNRFRAPYRLDGPMISVGTAVMTRMAALRPELGEQETHYLAALALARSARITGDLLHLYREGGTIAVTFTRSTVE